MVTETPIPKDKAVETLKKILFAVYVEASIPDLLEKLEECDPEHFCLYRGEL